MIRRDPHECFRFGVLFSRTGVTAATETSMLQAVALAVEDVNAEGGIDGREFTPVHFDPGSDPVYFNHLAETLLVDHGVSVIVGGYRSSARKAMIPVVERLNGLLLYPAQYEGFEYSRNVIYGGAIANQNNAPLADYMLRNFGARVFMVGSNYIWPREASRTLRDLIQRRGGEAVGEAYFKLDEPRESFDALVSRIRDASPDAVFCNLVGPTIGHFYRAYAEAGFDPERMPICSLTTSEADLKAMGPACAEGHITCAPYFGSIETEENRAAVGRLRERFGPDAVANMCWESAYTQVRLLAEAIRRTGTDEAEPLRRAMLGSEFAALQGRVRIDPESSHTWLWPRIGRAEQDGSFRIVEEAARAVRPDPYLTHLEDGDRGMRRVARASGA